MLICSRSWKAIFYPMDAASSNQFSLDGGLSLASGNTELSAASMNATPSAAGGNGRAATASDGDNDVSHTSEQVSILSQTDPLTSPFATEDDFTDIALLVEGHKLYTSRSLLALASPVFHCMFTSDFKEKTEKVVELPDKTYAAVNELLAFLHPGVNFTLMRDAAFRLVPLAEEYQIIRLKNECEDVLLDDLKEPFYIPSTFLVKYLVVAEQYGLPRLMERCLEAISELDLDLEEMKVSEEISLKTKSLVYERRIQKLEKDRAVTLMWKHRVQGVKQRLKDIINPHEDHCRCKVEIKQRNPIQRCCPFCTRMWCSDNISTDAYRTSFMYNCNHKVGYHMVHDATIRTFLDQTD